VSRPAPRALRWIVVLTLNAGCAALSPRPTTQYSTQERFTAEVSRWVSTLEHPSLAAVPIEWDDGFSPDEIALVAVVSNPGLRTVRDNRGIAHAQVIAAGLLPNPTISFQAYVPVAGSTSGNVVGYSGQLAWSIDALFARGPRVDAAELAEHSVELDIAWSEWQVAMQAQLLAYQIILLKQARDVHQTNIVELEETLTHIRHAASVDSVIAPQLASAESALSQATMAKAAASRDLAVRLEELRGVLGGMDGVVENLAEALPAAPDLAELTRDSLSMHLAQRRPDLQAMQIAMRSQNAAYQAATRQAFPSIQLGVQIARDPGDFLAIGPSIQIGLPVFRRGQVGRAVAHAQTDRLGDLFAERVNEARQRVGVALADARGTETTLLVLDEAIVRQQTLVDLYEAARMRDAVDILVFYAARSNLIQLHLLRVSERIRFWQGVVQMRSESGNFQLSIGETEREVPGAR